MKPRTGLRSSKLLLALSLLLTGLQAHADAVDELRRFVREVKTGQAAFTQTVASPDGAKRKTSGGQFAFARPDRFRFAYTRPFEQLIVSDGQRVWIHDPDLNQVSSRALNQALGATPAALLAGGAIDRDFDLSVLPPKDGLDWALATPKGKEGSFKSMRVGFHGHDLVAVEIVDAFDQLSSIRFEGFGANPTLPADTFVFKAPPGADVITQ